jgi:transposase
VGNRTVGQRVIKFEGIGRGVNGTLLAACDANGFVMSVCEFKEGAITTERFCSWLENQVEPILGNYSRFEDHSVVVMDSATQHRHPRVREIIERAGAILVFNAKYSPDLVPVEYGFFCTKAKLARLSAKVPEQLLQKRSVFRQLLYSSLAEVRMRPHFEHCGFPVPAVENAESTHVDVASAVASVVAIMVLNKRQRRP